MCEGLYFTSVNRIDDGDDSERLTEEKRKG
jgi:hypothetical protein